MIKEDEKYCSYILSKVSRTFAININSLKKSPIYYPTAISYLLCRIIDTIEDSQQINHKEKIEYLKEFKTFINDKHYDHEKLNIWIKKNQYISLNSKEQNLLSNSKKILNVFHNQEEIYKNIITPPIIRMIDGMSSFISKYSNIYPVVLKNEEELDKYCYYVAGTVGELLTDLFMTTEKKINHNILNQYKLDFGMGLQLTNILKDFIEDYYSRGISFIPLSIINKEMDFEDYIELKDKQKVVNIMNYLITKTKKYLDNALTYSLELKNKQNKIFTLIPLFFAISTLNTIKKNNFKTSYKNKINKKKIFSICFKIRINYNNNEKLKKYFDYLWEK